MTTATPTTEPQEDPGHNYTIVSLFALVAITSVLLHIGVGIWCLLPALVGLIAVATHWRAGPQLVLVSLACLLVMHREGLDPYRFLMGFLLGGRESIAFFRDRQAWRDSTIFFDLVLCMGVLAFTVAHYRSLSLAHHIFPPDPRRREPPPASPSRRRKPVSRVVEQKRTSATVRQREFVALLVSLPLWAGLAYLLWQLLTDEGDEFPKPDQSMWHATVLIWTIGAIVAVSVVVLRYMGQYQTTAEENQLFLQDEVWRETRREQSRLNRWLVWARRRWQRRKENES